MIKKTNMSIRIFSRIIPIISLIFSACGILSCASLPVVPPEYGFEKDAIVFNIIADPELNFYEGDAHPLSICVFQLQETKQFHQYANDKNGLNRLLECRPFDSSVINMERLNIKPEQNIMISMDRAKDVRYIAVVANYFYPTKDASVRLLEIPVIVNSVPILVYNNGTLAQVKTSRIAPMLIDLMLGPQKIEISDLNTVRDNSHIYSKPFSCLGVVW